MAQTLAARCITGPAPDLERALARDLAHAQADDPLAPIAVLIGGTLMRPYLQRRMAELCDGIVNVHFLTPAELALKLGERRLAEQGRRPLPPLADRVLLRQIAVAQDGYFSPVRDTPGFGDALHRLARELRGAGYDGESFAGAAEHACEARGKAAALGAIFSELLTRRSDFYGPDDCMLAADPGAAPWAWLGVYGLWDAGAVLRDTLAALAGRMPLALYLPATGTRADEAHAGLREWIDGLGPEVESLPGPAPTGTTLAHAQRHLFTRDPAPAATLDSSLRLLSAPDPTREAREVARTCLAWAREGIRFHEMAVVYRHQEAYRPVIESVFAEAKIPLYLHEGTPLMERPVGRRSLALLDLVGTELDRRAVMDFVTDARLPEATRNAYGGAPAARWDRLSRDAGIVGGREQWETRLTRLTEDLRADDRDYKQRNAEHVEDLRRFVADLAARLEGPPEAVPWSEHLAFLRALLGRYVHEPEAVLDPLAGLARLDAVSGDVSFERFRETVRGAIENLRSDEVAGGPPGAFARRGVNVLDASTTRHLRFRAVAIVGVAERSFPPPPRPDPLLLDGERRRLAAHGPSLPLRVLGADVEPLQFSLAVAAAQERLLVSYPRKGASGGRAQLPSSFFRELAQAARGEPVGAQKVDELPGALFTRVSGSRIGAGSVDTALSAAEHDRTLIETEPALGRAALVASEPRVGRAFAMRNARLEPHLTSHDGMLDVETLTHLRELRAADRPFSPSGIEKWATCPHKFLLGDVLRLGEVEEPDQTTSISPMDRGTLIHLVLQRFLSEQPEHGPVLHGPGEEARLHGILDEECDRAEARGETGYELMWRYGRDEMGEDMSRWLEAERADPAFAELPLGDFEVGFGLPHPGESDEEVGRLSTEDPIEITAEGATVRVHGRIDRLNWDEAESRFRVIDYKTGGLRDDKDGSLQGGRKIQLPIYLHAAAQILGIAPERGSAEYHYATRRGGFRRVAFDGDHQRERAADVDKVLSHIATAINAGVFARAPHEERACSWCDFDHVCPTARFTEQRRKDGDPHLRELADLREIE